MPIDFIHPEYKEAQFEWEMLEDIYDGERAIKNAGVKYLPMLGGQAPEEYSSYKERGSFFNAFSRTIQGLAGFIFRKPVKTNFPDQVKDLLQGIMSTGQSFEDLCTEVTSAVLKKGRVGLLVDSQGESDPYIAIYDAENIINWQTRFIEGEEALTLVVLKEWYDEPGTSEYDVEKKVQYRSIILRDDGVEVTIWRKMSDRPGKENWVIVDTLFPLIRGKRQQKIMFYFIGSDKNTSKVNKPPLIDMAYVNISHWRLSVDYRHGLHFCSLPTPWAAGFNTQQELTIGPVRVWLSEEPTARCGYLEFTGQGLNAVKSAIRSDEEQMAILGARIIEQTRSRVETAEASRIRQSGESGALTTISNNVSSGLTYAMKGLTEWMGLDSSGVFVTLNSDFMDVRMMPEEITALIKAYQSSTMSLDTLLWNFDKGELLPPGIAPEDEKLKIETEQEGKPFENNNFNDDDEDEIDDDADKDMEEESEET